MSTRATIHFYDPNYQPEKPQAIVFRHTDGYPEEPGLGQDLQRFVNDCRENVKDNRFSDATMLAARWIAWDSAKMREHTQGEPHVCNFLSVRVMMEDAGDIEYRYKVVCDGKPTITCERPDGKPVKIPKLKEKAAA